MIFLKLGIQTNRHGNRWTVYPVNRAKKIPEVCPHCGASNQTTLYLYQQYAQLVGVPLYAKGKIVGSECTACKTILDTAGMPASWRLVTEDLLKSKGTPYWIYGGAFVLLIIIGLVVFSIVQGE